MEELLKSRTQDLLLVNQDELLVKVGYINFIFHFMSLLKNYFLIRSMFVSYKRSIFSSQAKLCNVSNSLSAAQDQISQQLSQIKRLEGETQDYSDRMAQRDSECSHLIVRMANLTEEKQSLETENLLVKYAKEATVTSLATLQTDHEQVGLCLLVFGGGGGNRIFTSRICTLVSTVHLILQHYTIYRQREILWKPKKHMLL